MSLAAPLVTWHNCRAMASPAPTPQDLYSRLREIYEGLSGEKLARELDIGLRTLQRLKEGYGTNYVTTIKLLGVAGWIDTDGESTTRAQLARAKREMKELTRVLERTVENLP